MSKRFFSGDVVLFHVEGSGEIQGTVESMPSKTEVLVSNGVQYRRHPDELRLIRFDQSRRTVTAIHLLYQVEKQTAHRSEGWVLQLTRALDVLDPTGLVRQNIDETAKKKETPPERETSS
jgi:hypothetical protein